METMAITIEGFSKRFGRHVAVDGLSLQIPKGSIFALVGRHGAGKSTTLRTLLNLLEPSAGKLEILGLDSVADSLAVRRRVGYVAERSTQYPWMTVAEALYFTSHLHQSWDAALASSLVQQLALPLDRRIRDLSRGMRATLELVLALAPRPAVLILDDPTAGLDPIVRRDFLEVVISNVQSEGGTVLFSSHLLHELERVADAVAILDRGRLLMQGSISDLKDRVRKVRVVYPGEVPETFPVSVLRAERGAHQAVLSVTSFGAEMEGQLLAAGAESVEVLDLSLEEVFVEMLKGDVQ